MSYYFTDNPPTRPYNVACTTCGAVSGAWCKVKGIHRPKPHKARLVAAFSLRDGEVVGVDTDGNLICYNASTHSNYNCGETLESYGVDNLTPTELKRVTS